MIQEGVYAAEDLLPSERELMQQFGVGRPAIREALFHLRKMGLVELLRDARGRGPLEPALAALCPSQMPGVGERNLMVRRVRPRELFFPLPRLGNLTSLAAQVAGNSVQTTAYQGTRGKRWPVSWAWTLARSCAGCTSRS